MMVGDKLLSFEELFSKYGYVCDLLKMPKYYMWFLNYEK